MPVPGCQQRTRLPALSIRNGLCPARVHPVQLQMSGVRVVIMRQHCTVVAASPREPCHVSVLTACANNLPLDPIAALEYQSFTRAPYLASHTSESPSEWPICPLTLLATVQARLHCLLARMVRASRKAQRARPSHGGKASSRQLEERTKVAYRQRPALASRHSATRPTDSRSSAGSGSGSGSARRRPRTKAERLAWQQAHPRQPTTARTTTQHEATQRSTVRQKRQRTTQPNTNDVDENREDKDGGQELQEGQEGPEEQQPPTKRRMLRLVSSTADALSLLEAVVETAERSEHSKLTAEQSRETAATRRREAVEGRKTRRQQQQKLVLEQARQLLNQRRKAARRLSEAAHDGHERLKPSGAIKRKKH